MALSATNTYTGNTTISAGTLEVSGQLGSGSYSGTVANSGIFSYSSSSNQTLSGVISGSGSLEKSSSSILTLSATNTYSGDTTISAGTLKMTGTLADTTDVSKLRCLWCWCYRYNSIFKRIRISWIGEWYLLWLQETQGLMLSQEWFLEQGH